MPRKLTETATVIISSASTRADYKVLPVPKGLRAPAVVVRKTLASLLKDRLLTEVPAGREDAVWEQDEQRGRTTLVATPDGLKAIGIDDADPTTGQGGRKTKTGPKAVVGSTAGKNVTRATGVRKATKAARAPRAAKAGAKQTKQSILVAMLRRGGASIDDMVKATGWQPHSVRGVLTATIKNRLNLPLVSEKDAEGVRRYHIAVLREGAKT